MANSLLFSPNAVFFLEGQESPARKGWEKGGAQLEKCLGLDSQGGRQEKQAEDRVGVGCSFLRQGRGGAGSLPAVALERRTEGR